MAKKIAADKEPKKVGRPPKVKNGGFKKDDERLSKCTLDDSRLFQTNIDP